MKHSSAQLASLPQGCFTPTLLHKSRCNAWDGRSKLASQAQIRCEQAWTPVDNTLDSGKLALNLWTYSSEVIIYGARCLHKCNLETIQSTTLTTTLLMCEKDRMTPSITALAHKKKVEVMFQLVFQNVPHIWKKPMGTALQHQHCLDCWRKECCAYCSDAPPDHKWKRSSQPRFKLKGVRSSSKLYTQAPTIVSRLFRLGSGAQH